ncbi:hypothetical protein ACLVWU_08530 [Bdellovibrio sp. HCB290]|uniref:hypothetical protein n=1 Tax=Bdellovibrio sp. HCB290 TaxID=3394356 RepID=UPI0039B4ED52
MNFKIFQPPDRNFWVCRAERGRHFGHFMKHNLIAMSHFDKVADIPTKDREATQERLQRYINTTKIKKKTASTYINQTLHFIFDAKIGDLVITIDHDTIGIGKITSNAYFEKKRLYIKSSVRGKDLDLEMESYLRRDVNWVGFVHRYLLPHKLQKAISSQLTFFSLNERENEIYSLISPFVYKSDHLFTNLNITKKTDISAYHYQLLTNTVLKCEFLAKQLPELKNIKSEAELQKAFENFCRNDKSKTSLKAEFSSPGWTGFDVFLVLAGAGVFMQFFCNALAGGKTKLTITKEQGVDFSSESNGLLESDAVKYITKNSTDVALKHIDAWLLKDNPQALQDQLQLRDPGTNVDSKLLEDTKKPSKNDK